MNLMKINIYSILQGIILGNNFPSIKKLDNETFNRFKFIISTMNLNIVRIIAIVISIVVFIVYRYWRRNFKFDKAYIYAISVIIAFFMIIGIISTIGANSKKKNLTIGSSMNIGNALDAPRNIKWDVEMKKEYITHIKTIGFDAVRIPVRFSDYINEDGKLDEEFMNKVDYFVKYALDSGLKVILDMHNFNEIMENPKENKEKFLSLWSQISERYKDYSENLIFELLNEPQKKLYGQLWNEFLEEGVKTIRETNKTRKIIVGGDNFNSIKGLENLKLPKDNNLIVTFHYYEPNEFTFQGNEYHKGFENLKDIEWKGTKEEVEKIKSDFSKVKKWADKNKVPIYLGEFGVNKNAPRESRIRWIQQVREIAEDNNFSWGYWEMASAFGIYDSTEHIWDEEALKALLPNS